jgi:hypothetical protein
MGSAEVSWAMPTYVKPKSTKKQKAGAAGGHAKASAAKKQRTDTNAVLAPEAERALSQALLRVARCPAWSRVRVAHAHPLRLRLSPLARAGGTRRGGEFDGCGNTFCDTESRDGWCDGTPHRPDKLRLVLEWFVTSHRDFNEVIVDATFHSTNLPWSVEAIIDDAESHRKFLAAYQHMGVTASTHPLVRFDPDNVVEPFKVVGHSG